MVAHDQGVAVRPRFCDGVGGDDAVAAEAVFNNCRVPVFAEPLREDTGGKIAEAARRYADNDFDRLRRRKLCLHGHGCEIDAEHEQRGAEAASRRVGNPSHAVAPCPGARSASISIDQRSGCTTILTNPPGRVCTWASASLTFVSG